MIGNLWEGKHPPTISANSFKYDSTNKRLEAVITDNLSGVKDVLFTTKQTVDETDWSTASQYYEKDSSSDKYYSNDITIESCSWYCHYSDVALNTSSSNTDVSTKCEFRFVATYSELTWWTGGGVMWGCCVHENCPNYSWNAKTMWRFRSTEPWYTNRKCPECGKTWDIGPWGDFATSTTWCSPLGNTITCGDLLYIINSTCD